MSDMRQAKIEPQAGAKLNTPQPEAAERHDSGIRALAAVARHYQLDWSLQRLAHKYAKEREPDAKELVRIARAEGLKASAERTNWKYLARLQKLTPFLVRLDTGGYFVVLKVGDAAGTDKIVLFNPKAPGANLFPVEKDKFLAHWTGEIVLLKRVYKAGEEGRRFGLSWFVPEFWKQRVLLRNVVIAALALHVLALAVPIFFQIVIDRVLVYLSDATLMVIGIGVVLAILFDATFTWLRGYFVLRTASRIDILVIAETHNPGPKTPPDTASVNLGAGIFTFNGSSNIINKFGGIALVGNVQGNFIGTSGNNTLDASGDTTTGTIIFQGNGGTDTLKASGTALNVVDFAGSDWQYNAPVGAGAHPLSNTTVSTIPGNIVAPNAVIPAASDTLVGTFQRLKFLSPANVSDVNDDGFGDLIFQNGSGNLQVNLLGGAGPSPVMASQPGWTAVGTGQFTADTDRNASILLQDGTGDLGIESNITGIPAFTGAILGGPAGVTASTFTGWKAITAGDFNGDGASDVLLQQGPGGPVEIAFMNTVAGQTPGTVDTISAVTSPTGGNWNVISSGDFSGDGNSDILWQNSVTGALDVSLMNGAAGTPAAIGADPAGYTAIGTGDFNGDGKSDVLLENTTTGNAQIWLMNGTSQVGSPTNVAGPGPTAAGWALLGAEDINKDGFSDLLWQNSITGDVQAQAMTTGGATLGALQDLGTFAPNTFHLVASTGGG